MLGYFGFGFFSELCPEKFQNELNENFKGLTESEKSEYDDDLITQINNNLEKINQSNRNTPNVYFIESNNPET